MAISWPTLLVFGLALLLLLAGLTWGGRRWLGGAARSVDGPLVAFVAVTGAAIVVGWAATTLAIGGWFSLPALALAMTAGAAVLGSFLWRQRRAPMPPLAAYGWQELALGALLVVAALLYFRPHEYVLGGNDAGGYVNIANQITRTGNIVSVDEWTAFLGEHRAVTLREQPAQWLTRYLQFLGWYIDDANPARTVPQFFPFHPALLAVGVGLAGPAGALYVTPLWGVLNIAALYFLTRRLFDKNVALTASLFLTVTTTQIFFARYPTTEPLTMLLVFAALLAFQVVWDEPDAPWLWGLLGGAALGAALLTRIDLPLVLAIFIFGMLVRWWQRRWSRAWTAFAVTLAFFVLQMAWVVWQINWPYFYNTYGAIGSLLRADSTVIAAAGLALLLALGVVTLLRPAALVQRVAQWTTRPALRWTLAIVVVLLSLYAYFLRPLLEPPYSYQSWPENSVGLVLNGETWVRMGWYLTPFGLFLATVGLALILVRGALPRMTVVLGVGVLTTLQYLYNLLNAHYHIYAMRRYVPIVIPMLLLFAAVGALAFPMLRRRWITYTVRGLCVAGLAAGLFYQARFVLPQRDFAGALAQLDALEARLAPDALLLIAGPADDNFTDVLGTPLQLIYGHNVATLRSDSPANAAFLAELLNRAQATGRPVQLIADGALPAAVREHLTLTPVGSYPFSTQMLMNTTADFPHVQQTVAYGLEIYDVGTADGALPTPTVSPSSALVIDIGGMDSPYLGDGFHAKEVVPGQPSMRWTAEHAELHVPVSAVDRAACTTVTITLQAMTFLPAPHTPEEAQVTIDGAPLGVFTPTQAWQPYSFSTPAAALGDDLFFTVGVNSPTFSPAELVASTDPRDLGVLLDWVKITCSR